MFGWRGILKNMQELTLTTPAVLFSAISLIMLAYTNRFLAYAALLRTLSGKLQSKKDKALVYQIKNLRKRLYLTRSMQIFGIVSLLLCVLTMFLIYVNQDQLAVWVFGAGLICLIISLGYLIREIQISVKALEHHLGTIEERTSVDNL